MADISITAANVGVGASTLKTRVVQFGEAVTQGQAVYVSTSDSKYYRCDADTQATAIAAGIVLSPAATNGYGLIALPAEQPGLALVNLGATLAVGTVYAVSVTAGGIAPIADLATGDYITTLGVATTTALLDLRIVVSNTAKA
jgi:hypothetical protein